MSGDDVHPNEMNQPHDFDDATTDAFLSGGGRDVDAGLAALVGDMRAAYTSTPPVIGAELAALMNANPPALAPSSLSRRFEQMRSSMLAKVGSAAAVVIAATGGLAAAHALPAPVQDAVSHLGIGTPAHHDDSTADLADATTTTTADPSTTTMPADTTTTTADNHGKDVSAIARDHSTDGCEHGAAVSNVASDGRSHNDQADAANPDTTDTTLAPQHDSHDGTCETTTSIADPTTPTTTQDGQGEDKGDNHDTSTTIAGDTTPTSDPQSGSSSGSGDHGSNNGGDQNSGSGSDSGSGN